MIAKLRGVYNETVGDRVVIDVSGVGYGVNMTLIERSRLQRGEQIDLYIYEHIKEDAHLLFGFRSHDDQVLFEQLLSVKNVGPKVALSVLDLGPSDQVRMIIAAGDIKRLQSAKGVGKRAAEQIVVELRDKVGLGSSEMAEDIVSRGGVDMRDEAVQALVSLGYSELDATFALKGVDASLPVEERIKQALRGNA